MASNLTPQAVAGYGDPWGTNPHIFSSPNWYAYSAGQALNRTGRCVPTKASMGRGYSVNVETVASRFHIWFDKHNAPIIDRKD